MKLMIKFDVVSSLNPAVGLDLYTLEKKNSLVRNYRKKSLQHQILFHTQKHFRTAWASAPHSWAFF